MAGPLSNIAAAGLQKIIEQAPKPQPEKLTPSKFDGVMHKKLEASKPPEPPQKIFSSAPISKTTSAISAILSSLEQGSMRVDALLKSSLTKKSMSNTELLSMQAGMYKYTQELDLCSKVVDKAVNGLKDVLKTQV